MSYDQTPFAQLVAACNRYEARVRAEVMPVVELDHWPPHPWDRATHGRSAVFLPRGDVLARLNVEAAWQR